MIKGKTILAIIPARGGSKGIPRKNIIPINGKPLIYYAIKEAKKSKYVDRLIVSTEDEEIARVARNYQVEVIRRPKKYAKDNIPIRPDLIRYITKKQLKEKYDITVVIMATSVFIKVREIDAVIEKLSKTKADWVTTICEAETHPYRMGRIINDKLVPVIKGNIWAQRQNLPGIYQMVDSVYATWAKILDKKNCLDSKNWRGVIINKDESIDIHEPIDLIIAKAILKFVKNREK
ncbi:acylneuraminate cytidylyltransferase family protein [Candidatus Pacearchaeota archaeon]|nr:acylneuraminate cytidylyltransferase family protein [Candidatus Pacearchaeota archaeon]